VHDASDDVKAESTRGQPFQVEAGRQQRIALRLDDAGRVAELPPKSIATCLA
jgi:hypothetical protein